jgi:hypothetical protein
MGLRASDIPIRDDDVMETSSSRDTIARGIRFLMRTITTLGRFCGEEEAREPVR